MTCLSSFRLQFRISEWIQGETIRHQQVASKRCHLPLVYECVDQSCRRISTSRDTSYSYACSILYLLVTNVKLYLSLLVYIDRLIWYNRCMCLVYHRLIDPLVWETKLIMTAVRCRVRITPVACLLSRTVAVETKLLSSLLTALLITVTCVLHICTASTRFQRFPVVVRLCTRQEKPNAYVALLHQVWNIVNSLALPGLRNKLWKTDGYTKHSFVARTTQQPFCPQYIGVAVSSDATPTIIPIDCGCEPRWWWWLQSTTRAGEKQQLELARSNCVEIGIFLCNTSGV
jgi:hypothetical protein